MTQTERRHDRLAIRLSLIISRLVAGETLSLVYLRVLCTAIFVNG